MRSRPSEAGLCGFILALHGSAVGKACVESVLRGPDRPRYGRRSKVSRRRIALPLCSARATGTHRGGRLRPGWRARVAVRPAGRSAPPQRAVASSASSVRASVHSRNAPHPGPATSGSSRGPGRPRELACVIRL